MRRGLLLLFLSLLGLAAPPGAPAQNQAEVRAKLAQERDPIKRARLQIRLADFVLEEARKAYEEGSLEKGLAKLHEMLSLAVDAHDQLFGTGNDPRKKPKGFKEAEISLRELSRRLEDLRVTLPTDDRAEVEKIAARLTELRDHLLHGLMSVKKKK